MPEATMQKYERERFLFSPAVVFVLCSLFTLVAWLAASLLSVAENRGRFERSAASLHYAFKSRMIVYTNALVYTRNLLQLKPDLSADEFRDFVRGMNLREEYPGVTVIGYVRRYTREQLIQALPRLPENAAAALEMLKDDYDIVVYAESLVEQNGNALGMDLSVSPQRFDAMKRAAELGLPVATDKVTRISVLESPDAGSVFLVLVPHYRQGAKLDTPEERRAALVGFVYGGFRAPVLFGNLAQDAKMPDSRLILRVYDGGEMKPENLVYAKGDLGEASSEFSTAIPLRAADHDWIIDFHATEDYALPNSRHLPLMVLFMGVVLTVAVTRWAYKGQVFATKLQEDIEIRHRTEAQLQLARAQADSANRAKSLFLANVSHEIRTPLGIMLGFAELTSEHKTDADRVDENMKKILRNGRELTRIIGEVLDLSKIEANALLIEHADLPLEPFLAEMRADWAQSMQAKKLGFEFEVEPGLPAEIRTDSTRLTQILTNLLNNALKFTEAGRVRVRVYGTQAVGEAPAQIHFAVEDTGLGISEENKRQLFQTFSQGDSSITRRFGGSGLGLALSKQLALALGGDLRLVHSRPGEGSLFILSLPVRAAMGATETAAFRGRGLVTDLSGVRVLLVEDSIDNQQLISTFLEKANARVATADNGEDGVTAALGGEFDVVLMDIQMPVLDGYGAFERLRAAGYERPVIALTAHALIEEKEKAFDLGFFDYLTKPVNRKALIHAVDQAAFCARRPSENSSNL